MDHLHEMQEKDIGVLIRYGPGGKVDYFLQVFGSRPFLRLSVKEMFLKFQVVKQCLGYFPSVLLTATVSPITRTVLKVSTFLHLIFPTYSI